MLLGGRTVPRGLFFLVRGNSVLMLGCDHLCMGSGDDGHPLLGECSWESGMISAKFWSLAQQVISGAVYGSECS